MPVGYRTDSAGIGTIVDEWREWVLLDGHRGVVTGITAFALFVVVTLALRSGFAPLGDLQPLYYIFVGMITGDITVVTVVVSISQLLVSRELSTPDELRSQIDGVVAYRREVEAAVGRTAPVEPLQFLRLLFENTRMEAQQLGGLAITETDEELYERIDRVVSEVTDRVDELDALLQESGISTFRVLSVTLTTNYAREIHHLRRIQSRYGDSLPAPVDESIDDLVRSFQNVDIARQYFEAIYIREELAVLSRLLIYVGLPAIVVVVGGLFSFTATSGVSVPRPYFLVFLPTIITIGFLPLTLLLVYILRIATVSQRTAATLPFTTPTQEKRPNDTPK